MTEKFNANRAPIPVPEHLRAPAQAFKFVAVGRSIMRGSEHIATAISNTFARRIARALNHHQPNERGI